jgi:predicted ATPase
MFKRLKVQHFKSLANIDIELGPITILVGPNGSGKSNIVDVLRFLRDTADHGLDHSLNNRGGIDVVRQYSPTSPYSILLSIEYSREEEGETFDEEYTLKFSGSGEELRIGFESAIWYETHHDWDEDEREIHIFRERNSFERNKFGNLTINGEEDGEKSISPDQIVMGSPYVRSGFFYGTSLSEIFSRTRFASVYPNIMREPARIDTERLLKEGCSNWGSVIRSMRQRKHSDAALKKVMDLMREVMPNLKNVIVKNVGGYMVPQFLVEDKVSGRTHYLDPIQLSDGTLRLFGILLALYQSPPSIFLLLRSRSKLSIRLYWDCLPRLLKRRHNRRSS